MIARACSNDVDAVACFDCLQQVGFNFDIAVFIEIFRCKFAHDGWLLIDFLQHIMLISAFFRSTCVLIDVKRLSFNLFAVLVFNFDAFRLDDDNVSVRQFNELVRFLKHCHRIRTNRIETFANADQQRTF